jgi:uncharacterized membrane protein YfcA
MNDTLLSAAATHPLYWLTWGISMVIAIGLISFYFYIRNNKPEYKRTKIVLIALLIAFPFVGAWIGYHTGKKVASEVNENFPTNIVEKSTAA